MPKILQNGAKRAKNSENRLKLAIFLDFYPFLTKNGHFGAKIGIL
jgi:hypothetical protein